MASDKASSRNQSALSNRLAHLHEVGGAMLASFADRLTGDYEVTLVARNANFPGGSRDIVVTDDLGSSIVEAVLERLPDTAGSEKQTGLFLADRLIAIGAFRYALGRMTYMPSHVAHWLRNNRSRLSKADRELIIREIDEAADQRRLGMDCDVATWSWLREALGPASAEPPTSVSDVDRLAGAPGALIAAYAAANANWVTDPQAHIAELHRAHEDLEQAFAARDAEIERLKAQRDELLARSAATAEGNPSDEPAVVVDLGHGRWMIDRGTHEGHEALFFEPAPAPGTPMTPAPAFLPPDQVQPGTVCIRFDVPEAMTFLRWWLAYVQDPLRTPADPNDFAAAKWLRAWPAEREDTADASALSRALAMHDALSDAHRPTDSEPLRNCLPGIWPTVGDLRALQAERDDLLRHRAASEAPGWTYQGLHSAGAHLSDAVVAERVRMLMRGDLDFEAVCTMARDRIRDLSRDVARQRGLLGSRLPEGDALRILVEVGPKESACRMVVPDGMTFDVAVDRVEAAKRAIEAELAEKEGCPFATTTEPR